MTGSFEATWSRTWIFASLLYTCLLTRTFAIKHTFRSAIWWLSDVVLQAGASWEIRDHLTFWIWSTWWWQTARWSFRCMWFRYDGCNLKQEEFFMIKFFSVLFFIKNLIWGEHFKFSFFFYMLNISMLFL